MGINKKKKDTEELAKTQVINLEDVQKLATYEKLISKKPAAFVFVLGVMSIIAGLTAQTVVSLKEVNDNKNQTQYRKVEKVKKQENKLECTYLEEQKKAEQTVNNIYTIYFDDNDILLKYTKTIEVLPTSVTNPTAVTSITNGMNAFKKLSETNINGYKMQVSTYESGYKVETSINPNKLDLTLLSPSYTNNQYISPNIKENLDKESVKAWLETCKYECK